MTAHNNKRTSDYIVLREFRVSNTRLLPAELFTVSVECHLLIAQSLGNTVYIWDVSLIKGVLHDYR